MDEKDSTLRTSCVVSQTAQHKQKSRLGFYFSFLHQDALFLSAACRVESITVCTQEMFSVDNCICTWPSSTVQGLALHIASPPSVPSGISTSCPCLWWWRTPKRTRSTERGSCQGHSCGEAVSISQGASCMCFCKKWLLLLLGCNLSSEKRCNLWVSAERVAWQTSSKISDVLKMSVKIMFSRVANHYL